MISDTLSLIRVDLLKLRRRRGLMAPANAIAVGGVSVIFAVNAVRHGSNPLQNGPAGGIKNFENATDFIAMIEVVVAAMIGATAGAGDAQAGVLQDLVATGRSRAQLLASRATAGLGLTLAVLAVALVMATTCSVALAGLFKQFRGRFIGKVSPVHFFWGGMDLAVTRFSCRPAPRHPGGVPNVGDFPVEPWVESTTTVRTSSAWSAPRRVGCSARWPRSPISPTATIFRRPSLGSAPCFTRPSASRRRARCWCSPAAVTPTPPTAAG